MINWPFPILGTYGFAINVEKRIVARGISRFARKFKGEKKLWPKNGLRDVLGFSAHQRPLKQQNRILKD